MLLNRKVAVLALFFSLASGPVLAQECSGFWENSITSGGTNGAAALFVADLDGDGDADVVSASYNDEMIAWYENDGGAPATFTQHWVEGTLGTGGFVDSSAASGSPWIF